MSLGKDKAVAVGILGVLWINPHLTIVEISHVIHRGEASAGMSGLGLMRLFDDVHPSLVREKLQFFDFLRCHSLRSSIRRYTLLPAFCRQYHGLHNNIGKRGKCQYSPVILYIFADNSSERPCYLSKARIKVRSFAPGRSAGRGQFSAYHRLSISSRLCSAFIFRHISMNVLSGMLLSGMLLSWRLEPRRLRETVPSSASLSPMMTT